MKSTLFLSIAACLLCSTLSAQKLSTRNGEISFFSSTPVEDIEAVNNQVSSIIKLNNGQFAFLAPIKGFTFEKALMQEHFNENYMESSKFPNATFKGTIKNYSKPKLGKDTSYTMTFAGTMTIHGVEREFEEKATLKVKDSKPRLVSEFTIKPADYDIEIPSGKRDNISKTIEVKLAVEYAQK